jgi:hypothetical protein
VLDNEVVRIAAWAGATETAAHSSEMQTAGYIFEKIEGMLDVPCTGEIADWKVECLLEVDVG